MAKYATPADLLRLGLFSAALEGVSTAQQEQALAAACKLADGWFSERYVLPLVWQFLSPTEATEDGEGAAVDVFEAERLCLALDVSYLSFTPPEEPEDEEEAEEPEPAVLVVSIEESANGSTGWTAIASFDDITEIGHYTKECAISEKYVRIAWELTGNEPVANFGCTWDGDDLKLAICKIAAYELLSARGLDPSGRDENIIKRNDDAVKWLKDVRAGKTSPVWIDQTPAEEEQRSYVASRKNRGWIR